MSRAYSLLAFVRPGAHKLLQLSRPIAGVRILCCTEILDWNFELCVFVCEVTGVDAAALPPQRGRARRGSRSWGLPVAARQMAQL